MIAAIVPPVSMSREQVSKPLVTNRVVRPRRGEFLYGLSVVGDGGRITVRSIVDALNWQPGTRLDLTYANGDVLRAIPSSDACAAPTPHGHLRVPFRLRRRVGLLVGDRVLLVGHRPTGQLLLYPQATLDELFAVKLDALEAGRP
ncbi:hypothetical protein ACWEKT_15415 [Nocardia takedensis]